VFDCLGGVISPPERNTAWNKGRKCFHCLGAPTNLILQPWADILQFPVNKSDFNEDDTIVFCLGDCELGRPWSVQGCYILVWPTAWEHQGCVTYDDKYDACTLHKLCSLLHFILLPFFVGFFLASAWSILMSFKLLGTNLLADDNKTSRYLLKNCRLLQACA